MACHPEPNVLPYFNTSWAVLSTIGACYVLVGVMVIGIKGGVSALLLVPIIVSAACAIANGVHYYQQYLGCPPINQAVAFVFADVAWMIQEAGLPFYGYFILIGILRGMGRIIFLTLFWTLMFVILVIRTAIIVLNVRVILDSTLSTALFSVIISRVHIGYFLPIAIAESITAIFLLKTFRSILRLSASSGIRGRKLFRYLMRSTEIRVASLAFIGIARTITFSFNIMGKDSPISTQLDVLVYTLGSLFPIVMFIDIVAMRQAHDEDINARCHSFQRPIPDNGELGSESNVLK